MIGDSKKKFKLTDIIQTNKASYKTVKDFVKDIFQKMAEHKSNDKFDDAICIIEMEIL